jgi:cytosine/adenosine deaminase-related metal-dependent hydrolase
MSELVLKNVGLALTMNDAGDERHDVDILLKNGQISAIGPGLSAPESLECSGCLVTPGLVNTHHHLYQTLTRAVPGAQDAALFGWLQTLYPIWARFTPDHMRSSAIVGLAELALSGCTTSSDHLYLYPNGARLDDTIDAAAEVGLRFHPTRGAMSIGVSDGGLPPDTLVEDEAAILEDCIRVIDAFHDPSPGSMYRVGVAPCSPFSVSRELMRDAALLARDKGVMLHTHLAENDEDIAYSLEKFGCRPGQYAEDLGWVGDDVWHAHCVKLDGVEIDLFARSGTGVAHCPCSNCRLASGIAPVRAMRDAGVKVGLGVDGSASNDAGSLIDEARQTLLLQRVASGPQAMAGRRFWAVGPSWGRSRRGSARIWRSGTCAASRRRAVGIWPRFCWQGQGRCAICLSRVAALWRTGELQRPIWGRIWRISVGWRRSLPIRQAYTFAAYFGSYAVDAAKKLNLCLHRAN